MARLVHGSSPRACCAISSSRRAGRFHGWARLCRRAGGAKLFASSRSCRCSARSRRSSCRRGAPRWRWRGSPRSSGRSPSTSTGSRGTRAHEAPMTEPRPLSARQWAALVAALIVLNAVLTFGNVWPTLWILPRAQLSIELGVLLLVLVAWVSFVRPLGRIALTALTLLALAFVLGRYAEVTAPALYGRPVNLYWDS